MKYVITNNERLEELVNLIWETRWVSDDSDYQDMVAIAAAMRSGNLKPIDKLISEKKKLSS